MQPDSWPAGTARACGAYRYRAYNWAQFRIIIRRHDFSNEESTTRLHGDSVSVQLTFDCLSGLDGPAHAARAPIIIETL